MGMFVPVSVCVLVHDRNIVSLTIVIAAAAVIGALSFQFHHSRQFMICEHAQQLYIYWCFSVASFCGVSVRFTSYLLDRFRVSFLKLEVWTKHAEFFPSV